jgi:hypothetical protein
MPNGVMFARVLLVIIVLEALCIWRLLHIDRVMAGKTAPTLPT